MLLKEAKRGDKIIPTVTLSSDEEGEVYDSDPNFKLLEELDKEKEDKMEVESKE